MHAAEYSDFAANILAYHYPVYAADYRLSVECDRHVVDRLGVNVNFWYLLLENPHRCASTGCSDWTDGKLYTDLETLMFSL